MEQVQQVLLNTQLAVFLRVSKKAANKQLTFNP